MKTLKLFVVLLSFVILCGVSASAQTIEKPTNPNYDAALVKKLGADQRGMKTYILAILKTGPNDAAVKGKDRDEIFQGHFANINRMAKDGSLVVAGPFGDSGGDWRGLYVFNVRTIEEAKKLTETDPTIKSGVLIGEFHKWYGTAAMMEVTRIHYTLTPTLP